MKTKKLLDTIDDLSSVVEAAGAKKAAAGLRSLKALFSSSKADQEASDVLSDLRALMDEGTVVVSDSYLKRLSDAGTDQAAFNAAYGELQNDKRVDKSSANMIAHQYTKGRRAWPSRKAALEAIRKKFVERAYQEGKMRIVEKYKVG